MRQKEYFMNIYIDENKGIYFKTNEAGEQTLVRIDGTSIAFSGDRVNFEEYGEFAVEGWKRSSLFMKEFGIWDVTAFGCTMMAPIAFLITDQGTDYGLIFISCEAAERYFFKSMPDEMSAQCRANAEFFYANPELQKKWEGLILHPICLKIEKGGKQLIPIRHDELEISWPFVDAGQFRVPRSLLDTDCINMDLFDLPPMPADLSEVMKNHPNEKIHIIKRADYCAYAIEKDDSFIVLRGSTVNPIITGVMPAKAMQMRNLGLQEGFLSGVYKVMEDVAFGSSSAAAAFVVGHTVSGPKTWKEKK